MRARRVAFALALFVPALAAFWLSALFTLNHFHEGAFVWDSAWYSAIIHRQGFFPKNPPMVSFVPGQQTSYWGIHASLLVSLTSLASYVYPGDRVDWYCLFQGAIYVPLGIVIAMLLGRENVTRTWGTVLLTLLASLAFALNGQALACVGYPHFEILIPGGVCLMLVGLATGRPRLAYVGLAIAAGTREDGGFHAAVFLAAVLASDLLGAPFPVSRRRVVVMGVVAFGVSCLAFFVQKTFFLSASLFRHEYLGHPTLAHATWPTMVMRTTRLFESARFVVYPFFATVILAAVRRDARYLLGYAAGVPWFALNLFAAQELKSVFSIYTGFPFVTSIFWVAAYAVVAPRRPTPARTLVGLGVVSLVATLGFQMSHRHALPLFASYCVPPKTSHSALLDVARPLRANPNAWGSLWIDLSVAAWTIESMPGGALLWIDRPPPEMRGRDAFMFFLPRRDQGDVLALLARSSYERCGNAPRTAVYYCAVPGRELPPPFVPASPWLASLAKGDGVTTEGERIRVPATTSQGCPVFGPYVKLPLGAYRVAWNIVVRDCIPGASPARVDVAVRQEAVMAAPIAASGEVALDFEVQDSGYYEFRTWSGACALEIVDLRIGPPR